MRYLALLAVPAIFAAHPAAAQRLDNDWIIQVSAYFPSVDSSLRIDSSDGEIGTVVDLEGDLGFSKHSRLPAFLGEWRPGDDWVLTAEYYALNRDSSRSIARELDIGDTTFPVNASVASGFDSDVFRFTVGNRLFQGENYEIGAAIGLHGTDFTLFVEGEGTVNGVPGQFRSESRSVFAPVPTIGAFVNAEPWARVYASARFDWLSLSIGDYSGRVLNSQATVAYRVHRNFDVGLTYRLVNYRLKVNRDNWTGQVDYNFRGPAIFLQAGF